MHFHAGIHAKARARLVRISSMMICVTPRQHFMEHKWETEYL